MPLRFGRKLPLKCRKTKNHWSRNTRRRGVPSAESRVAGICNNFLPTIWTTRTRSCSAHRDSRSKLYSQAGKDLLENILDAVYQPEFYFNTTKLNGSDAAIKADMTAKVDAAAKLQPAAQTGLKATYIISTDSLVVATKTKFFQAATGEYRLAILLVEKEVQETQSSRSGMQPHKRVLRKTLTPDVTGAVLVSGAIAANTEFNRNFTIKWNAQYNLNNIEVITILWKRNNAGRLEFVNTNEVTQVERATTATQKVDFLANRFTIMPNPVREQTQIRLDLPQTYTNAEIVLIDIKGAVVKTVHRGNLNSGAQTIEVNRNSIANGLYFVRLRADGQVATRKVIFQ